MSMQSDHPGRSLLCALLLTAGIGSVQAETGADLAWETVFTLPAAAPALEAEVRYQDARGMPHTLHLWREGHRLRRLTDERLDLLAERDGETYHQSLVDRSRHLQILLEEEDLQGVGLLLHWEELATLLRPPTGTYHLARSDRDDESVDSHACRWYFLQNAGRQWNICWARDAALPLRIESVQNGQRILVLAVDRLNVSPQPGQTFVQDTAGMMIVDAHEELGAGSD